MPSVWEKIEPKDIVAMFLIMGIVLLILMGHNSILAALLSVIVTYYFARRPKGILLPKSKPGK